jgi:hypothetical protein
MSPFYAPRREKSVKSPFFAHLGYLTTLPKSPGLPGSAGAMVNFEGVRQTNS